MHQYLIPLAFFITFIFIIVRRPHKHNITINVDLDKTLGQQSNQYRLGYIRATECIRNGSDADILINQSKNNPFPDEWDKGWKDACKNHIKQKTNENIQQTVDQYQVSLQQNEILAGHRTGISKEDKELLDSQSI